ncbi:MAG: hypothetical protein QNJ37_12315 [Crocosphaera sp.]|nr:hypothetical protein [Crocosphaera sp.]
MSKVKDLKKSLNEYIDHLSEPNLELVYEFMFNLAEQEREEATRELLSIPDLWEDIESAKQDIDQEELTDWRDIRTDVYCS